MTTLTFISDFKNIGIGGGKAGNKTNASDRETDFRMQGVKLFNAESLNEPILDHVASPGKSFFTRLENCDNCSGKISVPHEVMHQAK